MQTVYNVRAHAQVNALGCKLLSQLRDEQINSQTLPVIII